MGQLRNGNKPVGARLDFLRPRRLQRRLGREHLENVPYTAAISIGGHIRRLLRSCQEITAGADALVRRRQSEVTRPDLQIELLLQRPRVLARYHRIRLPVTYWWRYLSISRIGWIACSSTLGPSEYTSS